MKAVLKGGMYGVWLLICLSACQRIEIPPDITSSPIYDLSWTESGSATSLEAGLDNYRIETDAYLDSDNIWVLFSRFEEIDCFDQCGASLEIRIHDLESGGINSPSPGLIQENTYYDFTGGSTIFPADTSIIWLMTFTATTTGSGANLIHSWEVDDTISVVNQESFTLIRDNPGSIDVCLTSTDNLIGNCTTTQCKTISPLPQAPDALSVFIEYESPANTNLYANVSGGVSPYTFSWSNGITSQTSPVMNPGVYLVEVTDASGNVATHSIFLPQGGPGTMFCSAQFDYDSEVILDISPGDTIPAAIYGTVEFVLEENGMRYLSRLGAPDTDDFFIIDSVEDAPESQLGKILSFRYQVRLYEEGGAGTKSLQDGHGKMLFAWPE